jgi:hypothetical protein
MSNIKDLRTAKEKLKTFAASINYPACVGVSKPFMAGLTTTHVRGYLVSAADASLFPLELTVGAVKVPVELVVTNYNITAKK